MKKRLHGFTLIELMIVIAVISIIAGVGYPIYQGYIQKTRRATAKLALMDTAQRLERCSTELLSYTDAGCNVTLPFNAPVGGAEQFYTISATVLTPSTFTLTATAIGKQVDDTDCSTLTLDHLGQKSGTSSSCW
ncbi:MAG TPA: prepilin-type N-terminal cleavage/methylation domain-containing protein [Sedimenticola sp.]|nr:prepilin-type N-terminal cleavage/methylation domain-containing protein [Sedimenticola sp.]